MNRQFGFDNTFYRNIDDAGGGGAETEEVAAAEEEVEEQPVVEAAPVIDTTALQDQLQQANDRIARMEAAQRAQAPTNDAAVYRKSLVTAIVDEYDDEAKEELRAKLYAFDMEQRFGDDLAHSRAQGATSAVLRGVSDVKDEAKPYIDEVVSEYGLTGKQVDAKTAQDVADMAWARAHRAGKITTAAPAQPAARTPVSAAAPTASVQKQQTFEGGLARDEKEHLDRYIADYTPPGADPAKVWTENNKQKVVREFREAKEYRASLS